MVATGVVRHRRYANEVTAICWRFTVNAREYRANNTLLAKIKKNSNIMKPFTMNHIHASLVTGHNPSSHTNYRTHALLQTHTW